MTKIQEAYYDGYEKGFQEGRKSEINACLKLLEEEQEEFAEDRDKNALNYVIAVMNGRIKKDLLPCICGNKCIYGFWNNNNEYQVECQECHAVTKGQTINESEKLWNSKGSSNV